MTSHINPASESMEWISQGVIAEEKPSMSFTRVEILLGFAHSPCVMDVESVSSSSNIHHHAHTEDHVTEMMEEDVWGDNDGDTSSFDDDENSTPSTMQWPDSETDSQFSALVDEFTGISRVAGIFSPSKFSPVETRDWEAMRGQIFGTSDIMSSGQGSRETMGSPSHKGSFVGGNKSVLPYYGPRSAPVEVPVWSNLRVMTKNRGNFVGHHEVNEDDAFVTRVPPHELVAKQHARSQISAFSVIEGTGRTLKGRDASKMRDGVWKQTGFNG